MDVDVEAVRAMQEPNHYARVGLELAKLVHQFEERFLGVAQTFRFNPFRKHRRKSWYGKKN